LRLPRPPSVPIVVGVTIVFLGVVLALSAFDARSTTISLNATSETFSFVTSASTATSEVLLRELAWNSGPVEVELPDGAVVTTEYFRLGGGPIALPPLPLPGDAQLTIRASGDRDYTILFSAGPETIEFVLPPGGVIDAGDGVRRAVGSADPLVRVRGIEGSFHVSGATVRRERLVESMPIRNFAFWREAAGRNDDVLLSTMRAGLLVMESVGGRRIDLREGEPFAAGRFDGILRSVAVGGDGVEIQLDGRAHGLRSGYARQTRSLMPSVLDHLIAIPEVKALLAVIAVLVGSSIPFRGKEQNASSRESSGRGVQR
jgi:hypothetical protein